MYFFHFLTSNFVTTCFTQHSMYVILLINQNITKTTIIEMNLIALFFTIAQFAEEYNII